MDAGWAYIPREGNGHSKCWDTLCPPPPGNTFATRADAFTSHFVVDLVSNSLSKDEYQISRSVQSSGSSKVLGIAECAILSSLVDGFVRVTAMIRTLMS